jgi:hypothetical protein
VVRRARCAELCSRGDRVVRRRTSDRRPEIERERLIAELVGQASRRSIDPDTHRVVVHLPHGVGDAPHAVGADQPPLRGSEDAQRQIRVERTGSSAVFEDGQQSWSVLPGIAFQDIRDLPVERAPHRRFGQRDHAVPDQVVGKTDRSAG